MSAVLRVASRPRIPIANFARQFQILQRTYAKESDGPRDERAGKIFSSKARPMDPSQSTEPAPTDIESRRRFASEPLPRSPPPSEEPSAKTFGSTSKPRPYSGRPPPRYNLPLQKVCKPPTRMMCSIDPHLETLATHHGIRCIRGSRLGCFLHRCLKSRENIKLCSSANHAHGQRQR